MAAFDRKVAIQIKGLRRPALFGGVCVTQGGRPRARNATATRDTRREGLHLSSPPPAKIVLVLCQRVSLLGGPGFSRGIQDVVHLVAGEVVESVNDGLGPLVGFRGWRQAPEPRRQDARLATFWP